MSKALAYGNSGRDAYRHRVAAYACFSRGYPATVQDYRPRIELAGLAKEFEFYTFASSREDSNEFAPRLPSGGYVWHARPSTFIFPLLR